MEFLVRIQVRLPVDMPEAEKKRLIDAELVAGRRMRADGRIVRIWRVPGRTANVGVWRADDADELHRLLADLPLFPWLDVDVQALASHPIEAADD
ncbi:muconolactone Delta-isomerase [Rhizohabitans arisaemae]|uniref:muconolactone Delta-isomerase n=1 Tax=Rhizohabitans arisaemae TaxID=2720610 RepID=UPI0024B1F360|nr:muconolactone Delta-isomerase family protein [Rhizohabitans arisaemae]